MQRPEMLIFDVGGTLLIPERPHNGAAGFAAVLKYCSGGNADPAEMWAFCMELDARLRKNAPELEIPIISLFRHTLDKYGLRLDIPLIEAEFIFDQAASGNAAAEDIKELFDYLDASGIRKAVISNIAVTSETLTRMIDAAIPGARFEFVMTSCDYIYMKPAAELFRAALGKAGLPPESVWYCGDSFYNDADGSHGVGMFPVYYTRYLANAASPVRDYEYLTAAGWKDVIKKLAVL